MKKILILTVLMLFVFAGCDTATENGIFSSEQPVSSTASEVSAPKKAYDTVYNLADCIVSTSKELSVEKVFVIRSQKESEISDDFIEWVKNADMDQYISDNPVSGRVIDFGNYKLQLLGSRYNAPASLELVRVSDGKSCTLFKNDFGIGSIGLLDGAKVLIEINNGENYDSPYSHRYLDLATLKTADAALPELELFSSYRCLYGKVYCTVDMAEDDSEPTVKEQKSGKEVVDPEAVLLQFSADGIVYSTPDGSICRYDPRDGNVETLMQNRNIPDLSYMIPHEYGDGLLVYSDTDDEEPNGIVVFADTVSDKVFAVKLDDFYLDGMVIAGFSQKYYVCSDFEKDGRYELFEVNFAQNKLVSVGILPATVKKPGELYVSDGELYLCVQVEGETEEYLYFSEEYLVKLG